MNLNLNYEEFKDNLLERRPAYDGVQYLFRFPNDYGASIIKHFGSYRSSEDLWELAVIYFEGEKWGLTYDTEITDDVVGNLTDQDVLELLRRIQALK